MIPERVGAILNPQAGRGDTARLFADLTNCLPATGMEARITTEPEEVPEAVREQSEWADLLVAIGGDGTLREVAAAIVEHDLDTPLFVVPAGRGNSSYRHLYGDADWRELARGIGEGIDARPVDVGRAKTEPAIGPETFVLGFTAGLFRNALRNAERLRLLPGRLAYVLATAQATVIDNPVSVEVDIDEEPVFEGPARLVAVGGGRYRGRTFELFPESRPGDGTLHLLAVEPAGVRGSFALLRRARAGHLQDHPAVTSATGDTVAIRSADGVPVELDGTVVETPVREAQLSVVPEALSVAYPDGA